MWRLDRLRGVRRERDRKGDRGREYVLSISSGIQLSLIVCEIDLMVVSIFKRAQGNCATRWISASVYVLYSWIKLTHDPNEQRLRL